MERIKKENQEFSEYDFDDTSIETSVKPKPELFDEPDIDTFEVWANKWLELYKLGTVKKHTYTFNYKLNIERYLIPYFKKTKLNDIQQSDIQEYFNTVMNEKGKPLTKPILDKQKMILNSLFDAAIENNLCHDNPVKNIKYQNVTAVISKHIYNREEALNVIEYSKERGRIDIVILLETGVRRAELLGLKWSDIDFEKNTLHIQRTVTQKKKEIIIEEIKSKTSNRFIPISKAFSEYLKMNQNEYEYIIGTDQPQSPSTYASKFRIFMKEVKKATFCPLLTPHELRHTFGTLLYEEGADISTIQKIMGHADISITTAIYVRHSAEALKKQMKIDAE